MIYQMRACQTYIQQLVANVALPIFNTPLW
jgi:hypothetical protein